MPLAERKTISNFFQRVMLKTLKCLSIRNALNKPVCKTIRQGKMVSPLDMWSKRRILEVYLNVIEWGNGIYGAEAAARR
jgi:membrane carboxypeptidase/penicillin-binding protein PbpC